MSWQTAKLGDICTFTYGKGLSQEVRDGGSCNVFGSNGVVGKHSKAITSGETIVVGRKGSIGEVNWNDDSCWPIDTTYYIDKNSTDQNLRWIYWMLKSLDLTKMNKSAAVPGLNREDAYRLEIKVPTLAEQKRIAAILDKATEIKAKREQAIDKLDDLLVSTFEESCSQSAKQTVEKIKNLVTKRKLLDRSVGNVWSLALDQIESNSGEVLSRVIVNRAKLGTSTYYFEPDVVLYSKLRPYLNKVVIPDSYGYATTELVPLYCNKEIILPSFMAAYLRSPRFVDFANTNSAGAKMPRVIMDKFWDYEMLVPNLEVQNAFQKINEKCIAMKMQLKRSIEKQDSLIQSLQHQAFTTGFNA